MLICIQNMVSTQVGGPRKGAWNKEEDNLLRKCIEKYGEGKWHQVPHRAGLNRCRKSCRLRWLNYLSPNIRRGNFTPEEDDLIIRLQKLLGNRWSLITGRLPGRTANEVKNHWNHHLQRKLLAREEVRGKAPETTIWKPTPRKFKRNAPFFSGEKLTREPKISTNDENPDELSPKGVYDGCGQFWSNLLNSTEINGENEAAGSTGISLGLHEENNGLIDFSLDMDIWELLSS